MKAQTTAESSLSLIKVCCALSQRVLEIIVIGLFPCESTAPNPFDDAPVVKSNGFVNESSDDKIFFRISNAFIPSTSIEFLFFFFLIERREGFEVLLFYYSHIYITQPALNPFYIPVIVFCSFEINY